MKCILEVSYKILANLFFYIKKGKVNMCSKPSFKTSTADLLFNFFRIRTSNNITKFNLVRSLRLSKCLILNKFPNTTLRLPLKRIGLHREHACPTINFSKHNAPQKRLLGVVRETWLVSPVEPHQPNLSVYQFL
jgi:hypothetical protein